MGADEVVLWFEHDLHCQLMLVRLLGALRRVVPRVMSLVGPGHYLSDADVAALFHERQAVSPAMYEAAARAWMALTSPDPTALDGLETRALPHLGAALRRHVEQFPATAGGLGRTDRAILASLADGPRSRTAIFEAAKAAEETPYMGDTIFWDYLEALARGPVPLVSEDAAGARLTNHGRDVLAGRTDAIALRGIDRWLGGVHLMSEPAPRRTSVWRWNGRTLVRE